MFGRAGLKAAGIGRGTLPLVEFALKEAKGTAILRQTRSRVWSLDIVVGNRRG